MLHRQAYQLQKANDPKLTSIACRRSSALGRSREWTPQERMEWQANALAPRILMPEWSTRMLTDHWLRRMEKLSPKYRMDRIVEKLSCHFEVSRSLARIRLIELVIRMRSSDIPLRRNLRSATRMRRRNSHRTPNFGMPWQPAHMHMSTNAFACATIGTSTVRKMAFCIYGLRKSAPGGVLHWFRCAEKSALGE
jgi:hypothetical protein